MTNRTKPGPGMGPSWKELIESGEFQRILDRGVKHKGRPKVLNKGSLYAPIPDGAKLVGRTTRWGNPLALDDPDDDEERAAIIRMHREWVLASDEPETVTFKSGRTKTYDPRWVREHVSVLRGLDLVCPGNCKPRPCHADVLLELRTVESHEPRAKSRFEQALGSEGVCERYRSIVPDIARLGCGARKHP